MRSRYSPSVLKLAAEHGIELDWLQGSGLGGRITRKDVEQAVASGTYRKAPVATAAAAVPALAQAPLTLPENAPSIPVRTTGIHLSENPPLPKIEVEARAIPPMNISLTLRRSAIRLRAG